MERPQYAAMGKRRVRSLSGIGGSKDGSGVSWYSGRGGRFEKSSMADVVAICLSPERSKAVLLTRHEAGIGPLRPGITRARKGINTEVMRCIKAG